MAFSKEHRICDAIHQRRQVKLTYRGGGPRIVEPYACGISDGAHPILRAYQLSGDSPTRDHGWKLFHLEDISHFEILEDGFDEPRVGYMRNDPTMTKIYCEV